MGIRITEALLKRGQSDRGQWNRKQLKILGVSWPPRRGWKEHLIGKEIDEETAKAFINARTHGTLPPLF